MMSPRCGWAKANRRASVNGMAGPRIVLLINSTSPGRMVGSIELVGTGLQSAIAVRNISMLKSTITTPLLFFSILNMALFLLSLGHSFGEYEIDARAERNIMLSAFQAP